MRSQTVYSTFSQFTVRHCAVSECTVQAVYSIVRRAVQTVCPHTRLCTAVLIDPDDPDRKSWIGLAGWRLLYLITVSLSIPYHRNPVYTLSR